MRKIIATYAAVIVALAFGFGFLMGLVFEPPASFAISALGGFVIGTSGVFHFFSRHSTRFFDWYFG